MGRFRFGLLLGFALGYWFGTKAGRERHRQLSDLLQRARENEAVAAAADRARDLLESGVDRGKELVDQARGDDAGRGSDQPNRPVTEPLIDAPTGANGSVNPGMPLPEIT